MFKSKLEVDRHVSNCLKKINNETERNLRCFSFGKLYFNVGDYEQAYRYVTSYLSVKPKSAEGYLLLGKSLEKLGKIDAALQAYRNSLQIDPKQNNVIIKVCELLSSDNVELDLSGARYFCDLALSFDPNNPAVYGLKEKLIRKENENPIKITELLLQELEIRPGDINLRIRLLKHFIQNNMVLEAYKHASTIEEKHIGTFCKNLSWYENFADILLRFQKEQSAASLNNWEFWLLSVSVLERLVALSLEECQTTIKPPSTDYLTAVFNFDQVLNKAYQNKDNFSADRNLVSIFFKHYHAQLYFHISTIIFKQIKRDSMEFKEASNFVLPLLFTAYHSTPPDLNSVWLTQSSDNIKKKLVNRWHQLACYRNSQVGHILLAAAKDRKSLLLEKAARYSTGMWRENLYKKLFVRRDQQLKISSSFFVINNISIDPTIKLPIPDDLSRYDEVAQLVNPDYLHHYVWIALNSDMADMNIKTFEGLQFSTTNMMNCAAESLNQLDIYAFICCATLCANTHHTKDNKNKYFSLLPSAITDNLCSLNQSKFLESAYRMYKNDRSSNYSSDLRVLLIKGIEVTRCVGHHGLDVKLLVILAKIFEERAKRLTQQSEIDLILARAELYWKTAIPLLEKVINKEAIGYSNNRLFEYKSNQLLKVSEAESFLEKGKLFIAIQLYKKKDFEKALTILNKLKDPYASFYLFEIYKSIADQKKRDNNKENFSDDEAAMTEYKILLSKARDCLYLTLDRLREPSYDISHPLNSKLSTEIGKVERLLVGIESDSRIDLSNSDESLEENHRSFDTTSVGERHLWNFTALNESKQAASKLETNNSHSHSTPLRFNVVRQEVRPSPERLDAQIRQIMTSRDASFSIVAEQNKAIVESQKNLLEKLNFVIDDLKTIKTDIEDLKEVTKSVNEIRNTTDNFQNVVDIIQDIRKDLNEVKKNESKNNQLSEEDLYVLDPDYGVDYHNIAANIPGANIPGAYPNYPTGRIPNPNHIPAYGPSLMYPGLYPPGLSYTYGGINFAQPGSLPFMPEQPVVAGLPPPTSLPSAALIPTQPNTKFGLDIRKTTQIPFQNISQQPKEDAAAAAAVLSSNINQIKLPTAPTPIIPLFGGKSPPLNVVITTSDPLPTQNVLTTSQPVLSVTIPPQHVKSNFNKIAATSSTVSALSGSLFVTTTSVSDQERSSTDKIVDVSSTSTNSLEDEPNIHFKPVIPLPDEVPVYTGEENENELFCARAKLFRHININGNKEWKERGVGNLKILKNRTTGKSRILMRRDQVLKVCANHLIQKDMILIPTQNNDRAFTWIAQDFSEGELYAETFCVKFKTAEDAKMFSDVIKSVKETDQKIQDDPVTTEEGLKKSGFVFTGTPTFKPKELLPSLIVATPEKPKDIVAATTTTSTSNSPFATFVFGKGNAKKDEKETKTFSPLVITQEKKTDDGTDLSPVEEFVPTAEFKPVVPLPELVEIKTGEENSQVLFEARTKLFRYDGESKEWKERGVGTIKILKDDFLRLVMRRDQVHKVCCNHRVPKDMIFNKKCNNSKAIVWQAQDYSEELVAETFTARFKTEETADQFLQTIENMQKSMDDNNSFRTTKNENQQQPSSQSSKGFSFNINNTVLKQPEVKSDKVGFGDAFKVKPGSWECKICLIRNEGIEQNCVACDTPKDGIIVPKPTIPKTSTTTTNFMFNWNSNAKQTPTDGKSDFGFGDAFKVKAGSWECKTCLIRNDGNAQSCVACDTPKDGALKQTPATVDKTVTSVESKWVFGIPTSSTNVNVNKENKPAAVANINTAKPFSTPTSFFFGSNQNEETTKSAAATIPAPNEPSNVKSEPKWVFGKQPSTPVTIPFGGVSSTPEIKTPVENKDKISLDDSVSKKSPGFVFGSNQKEGFEFKQRTPRRISGGPPGNEESDGSYVEEEEEDNIYFKPIIPLPDKVQVKTGEEEEDIIFCQRAKLFRFANGEWKERGLGDVKILRNKVTDKLRVVMRREQVLKICLNHMITKDIEYIHKDERSLLFAAADFSEGELVNEQFCLRFKNADFAHDFETAVSDALQGSTKNTSESPLKNDEEVVIVSETQVTPEEEEIALRLGLPPKFLSYKQLPDCNCEQCKKDDEYLKDLFATESSTKNSFSFTSSTFVSSRPTSSTGFGLFGASKPPTVAATPSSNAFSKPNTADPMVKFSFAPSPATTTTTTAPTSLFASPVITTKSSLFSSPVVTSSSKSLFSPSNSFSSNNSIFGNSTSANFTFSVNPNNLFNNVPSATTTTATSNLFSSLPPVTKNDDPLKFNFENKPFDTIFGGAAQKNPKNIFGNTTPNTLQTTGKSSPINIQDVEEPILKCDSNLSFASLAANRPSGTDPAFAKKGDDAFAFMGAGAPVFGSLNKSKVTSAAADTSQTKEEDDEEENHNEDYDPHYEPIIPLPDQITVTTGEENEDVLFNERAKLFRFDTNTKEWKERGIGQFKVLKHREQDTYRLLLRREQVYKIVLNQLISPNLDIQPMLTSDKAWMWAGYNYTDNENSLEKLAVRFKNVELANRFRVVIENVIDKLQKNSSRSQNTEDVPISVQNFEEIAGGTGDGEDNIYKHIKVDVDNEEYDDDEYGEEEEEEDDDDEEKTIMFIKDCTLSELQSNNEWQPVGKGELQVYYDPDLYAARIQVTEQDGKLLSQTLIGMNTLMDIDKNECTWKATDWGSGNNAQWRNLRATFDTDVAAQEFHSNYIESLNYAQQIGLVDELPLEYEPEV